MRSIYKKVINVLYILVYAFCIFLIIVTLLSNIALIKKANIPISLWYVTSNSMEPTLKTNDGFIVLKSKDLKVHDIITFKTSKLKDPYVTHRIYDITEDGRFITKGDHNPVTDQLGDEPLVSEEAVVGKVLTVGNKALVFPRLGVIANYFMDINNVFRVICWLIAFLVIRFVIVKFIIKNESKSRKRLTIKNIAPYFDYVFIIFTIVLILNALFISVTVKSFGTIKFSYIVVSTEGLKNPMPNERYSIKKELENKSFIPFVTILQAYDADTVIKPSRMYLESKSHMEYSVSLTAPDTTGYYTHHIRKLAYPDVLPHRMFDYLFSVDELLPLIVIFAPGAILCIALLIIWIFRWYINGKLIMDWLIPIRGTFNRFVSNT